MQVIHMHEAKNATQNQQERMTGGYQRHGGQRHHQNKPMGGDRRQGGYHQNMSGPQHQQPPTMGGQGMPMPNAPMQQMQGMQPPQNFKGMPQAQMPAPSNMMPPQMQQQ